MIAAHTYLVTTTEEARVTYRVKARTKQEARELVRHGGGLALADEHFDPEVIDVHIEHEELP